MTRINMEHKQILKHGLKHSHYDTDNKTIQHTQDFTTCTRQTTL